MWRKPKKPTETHLIDIHDGENRLIQEFGLTEKGNFISLISFPKGIIVICEMFYLREAAESLQDDVKLSSFAGTDRDPGGLQKHAKHNLIWNLY